LSTSKKWSELFANLENEVGVEDAVHFSVRLMDEDEVPSEVKEKVVNQNTSSIPTEAVEMMKLYRKNFAITLNDYGTNSIKGMLKHPQSPTKLHVQ
jgi:hypothetical protein